jgi:transcriptional regulator of aromatic amino acid metabolism
MAREWPGNTRQLENLIRGWYAMIPDMTITLEHLKTDALPMDQRVRTVDLSKPYQELKEAPIEAFTRQYLNRLLRHTGGHPCQRHETSVPAEDHQALWHRCPAPATMTPVPVEGATNLGGHVPEQQMWLPDSIARRQ